MKTGRRIANPASKQLAGTFRADRHGDIAPIAVVASNTPTQPAYMTTAGKLVWAEEIARITNCGATDADSSMIARYCEMEAAYRVAITAGELPKAALLTELRRMAEMLCIAGLRSRLAKTGSSEPSKTSPFTVRK